MSLAREVRVSRSPAPPPKLSVASIRTHRKQTKKDTARIGGSGKKMSGCY